MYVLDQISEFNQRLEALYTKPKHLPPNDRHEY